MLVLSFVTLGSSSPSSSKFAPGWNGLARTPPLAWRSYNAQVDSQFAMTQANFVEIIDALADRSRTVAGVPTSLLDLGYSTVGIDGGYELCPGGTGHDADGRPIINTATFPNITALAAHAHALHIKLGWYLNVCGCPEKVEKAINYEGDVKSLFALGFDGAKFDGCGSQMNSTFYAELMNTTGKSFLIENCHWGVVTMDDTSSVPTREWCPMNFYRTSGDIRETWNSWTRNLLTVVPFLNLTDPLSMPSWCVFWFC